MERRGFTSKGRNLTIFLAHLKPVFIILITNNRRDQNDRKISWGKNLTLTKESRPPL